LILSCNNGSGKCTLGFLSPRNWISSSRISLLSIVQFCCWDKRDANKFVCFHNFSYEWIDLFWLRHMLFQQLQRPLRWSQFFGTKQCRNQFQKPLLSQLPTLSIQHHNYRLITLQEENEVESKHSTDVTLYIKVCHW
jgi:hypothetical protein